MPFAPDTHVITSEGIELVDDINNGSRTVWNGIKWVQARFSLRTRNTPVYKVTLANNYYFIVTADQKLNVKYPGDPDWKLLQLRSLYKNPKLRTVLGNNFLNGIPSFRQDADLVSTLPDPIPDPPPEPDLTPLPIDPLTAPIILAPYLKGFLNGIGTSYSVLTEPPKVFLNLPRSKYESIPRLILEAEEIVNLSSGSTLQGFYEETEIPGFRKECASSKIMLGIAKRNRELIDFVTEYKIKLPEDFYRWMDIYKYRFIAGLFDAYSTYIDNDFGWLLSFDSYSLAIDWLVFFRTVNIFSRIQIVYNELRDTYRYDLFIGQQPAVDLSSQLDLLIAPYFNGILPVYQISKDFSIISKVEYYGIVEKVYHAEVPGTDLFAIGGGVMLNGG